MKQTGVEIEPKVIVIEVPEQTPREKTVEYVATTAQAAAVQRLGQSNTLVDYLRWHRAASIFLTSTNIDWIWDYGGTTPEELIEEQESERFTKGNAKDASTAEEMKPVLDGLEPKTGMVRVALKRIRNDAGVYDYGVLAAFPERSVNDPLDGTTDNFQQRLGEDIVFFRPENACIKHSCDDLFKINRNQGFYMPLRSLTEAKQQLQQNKTGAIEYLIEKRDTGNITQDSQNYILVGLLGGYSNERFRTRVSDFWNRQRQVTTQTQ